MKWIGKEFETSGTLSDETLERAAKKLKELEKHSFTPCCDFCFSQDIEIINKARYRCNNPNCASQRWYKHGS